MEEKKNVERTGLEIAVIGMAGRFPGAKHIDEFWENLKQGDHSMSFITDEEIKELDIDEELLNNPNYVRGKGGVLEDAEYFDASFFGFIPDEADLMDPQVRLFLECTWHALEDAGYDPDSYNGLIGVYAGASSDFYWTAMTLLSGSGRNVDRFSASLLRNNDSFCTRICFNLNLRGPGVTLNTACSTSLVAVDHACRGLLTGICDMALAGGVSLSLSKKTGYIYSEGMIASPDGYCRAFDADAGGTIGGQGVGIVLLKRLNEAIADRDHIYAVIKGFAINNDGFRKAGYTAPSPDGQAEVIRAARQMAEVEFESIGYIEAHGTGTALGDPVEIEALKSAFNTDQKQFCGIGSVKSNIGHLDAAAGITGFIKTVLVLTHKEIPPTLHFKAPNPEIDFINSPFYVNAKLKTFENGQYPLRAGVSSFGIGGTNAHVILEEPPERTRGLAPLPDEQRSRQYQLFLLSAKTETALDRKTGNLVNYLKKNPELNAADAAYTLQVGRKAFQYRKMMVCSSIEETIKTLSSPGSPGVQTSFACEKNRPVVFMFPGSGCQYVNMGLELYEKESYLHREMDRCFEILKSLTGHDIKEILYPFTRSNRSSTSYKSYKFHINQPEIAQTVIFIIQYALARLLMHWGITPRAMIGHSLGEYTAACLAGVFSLEDALSLVLLTGKSINQTPGSTMMRPSFEEFIAQVKLNKPGIPYISSSTGTWISADQAANPAYWTGRLLETGRSREGIKELCKEENSIFIQIGPDKGLPQIVSQLRDGEKEIPVINLVKHQKEKISDFYYLLNSIGLLWLHGIDIDWTKFYPGKQRYRVSLPTYPFERQFHWIEGDLFSIAKKQLAKELSLPGRNLNIADWFYLPSWKSSRLSVLRSDTMSDQNTWLIFIDDGSFASKLVINLKQYDQQLITVKTGSKYSRINANEFLINPAKADDYDYLFEELVKQGKVPLKIVYMWTLPGKENEELTFESLETGIAFGFNCLVYLAQAIGEIDFGNEHIFQLFVLTSGMQETGGEKSLHPEYSVIFGPLRVIPLEYPNIVTRAIDIDLVKPGSWQEAKVIQQMTAEFMTQCKELLIVYRNHERLVKTVEPIHLDKDEAVPSLLKEKGTYWITGGLSGIGFEITKYLAETLQAKLILTGRSPFPPGEQWEQWLVNHDDDDAISEKIRKLKELEAKGAEILVLGGNVSDIQRMEQIVLLAQKRFGTINGVLHLAAVPDGCLIQRKTGKIMKHILEAKVKGTLVLYTVLEKVDLDFFVLFSSNNSLLPTGGQAGYCAANAFLDAFANYMSTCRSTPFLAINWDMWRNTGMAALFEVKHKEITGEEFKGGMTPQEGIDAFERIMRNIHPQIMVSTNDLRRIVEMSDPNGRTNKEKSRKISPAKTLQPRPRLSTAYIAPGNESERNIVEIWQNFFGIEPIGIEDNFFEMGGDSLRAIGLIERIQKELGVGVPVAKFFANATTIKGMVEYISGSAKESTFAPINPVEEKEFYEVSFSQKRLWIISQLEPDSSAYNVTDRIPLQHEVNENILKKVLYKIAQRHASLRTGFKTISDEPRQFVAKEIEIPIKKIDLSAENEQEKHLKSSRIYAEEVTTPFELSKSPLFRVILVKLSSSTYEFIFNIHHIITDELSMGTLRKEFALLYETYRNGKEVEPQPLKLQYKDFAQWQNQQLTKTRLTGKSHQFWKEKLKDGIPLLELPVDFKGNRNSRESADYRFVVSKDIKVRLDKLGREHHATLFTVMFSTYNILLSHLFNQEDIACGIISAGRGRSSLYDTVGYFTNAIIFKCHVDPDESFNEFLHRMNREILEVFGCEDYPLELVFEELDMKFPEISLAFNMLNMDDVTGDLELDNLEPYHQQGLMNAKFDIEIYAREYKNGIEVICNYKRSLFRFSTIQHIMQTYLQLLDNISTEQET
jgi:acyl transferase domain-containing protein/acyl carrier protein